MRNITDSIRRLISSTEFQACEERLPYYSGSVLPGMLLQEDYLANLKSLAINEDQLLTIKDGEVIDVDSSAAIESYLQLGCTVVVNDADFLLPELAEVLTCVQERYVFPCGVNFYATPANSRGFLAHFDPHDIFVFQLTGSKHWKVFAPHTDLPLKWEIHNSDVSKEEPWAEFFLNPGDCLYLPRGWIHEAASLGSISTHATVAIHGVAYADILLDAILRIIEGNPSLRKRLHRSTLDPANLADVAEIFSDLGFSANAVEAEALNALKSLGLDLRNRVIG